MLGVPPPGSFLRLTEPVAARNPRTSLAGLGLDRRVYFKGGEGMNRKISSVCSLTLHSHLKPWKRTVTKVQITQHPEWVKKFCHLVEIVENYNLETNAQGHLLFQAQFSSVAQLCLTLCYPMDCSTPGLSSLSLYIMKNLIPICGWIELKPKDRLSQENKFVYLS